MGGKKGQAPHFLTLQRRNSKLEFNSIKGESNQITVIVKEVEKLGEHIKTYSVGSFPVFYLQLNSVLKVQDIIDMRLRDVYLCENGNIRVKESVHCGKNTIELTEDVRREMAWYAVQRIKVRRAKDELLGACLCVNKQGKQLQKQVYRKMLERASGELGLSRVYNSGYLRCLYGYLEIAYGNKTVDDVAREYGVERYYLLNRMFKGMRIEYDRNLLEEVASIPEGGALYV